MARTILRTIEKVGALFPGELEEIIAIAPIGRRLIQRAEDVGKDVHFVRIDRTRINLRLVILRGEMNRELRHPISPAKRQQAPAAAGALAALAPAKQEAKLLCLGSLDISGVGWVLRPVERFRIAEPALGLEC